MITICPNCKEECFDVQVTGSGSYFDPEWGTIYWGEGDGKCSNKQCGYQGWWSDTSA